MSQTCHGLAQKRTLPRSDGSVVGGKRQRAPVEVEVDRHPLSGTIDAVSHVERIEARRVALHQVGVRTHAEPDIAAEDRRRVVDWLATQSQLASRVRRGTREHSSFRRLARYEYGYALRDLLGREWGFDGLVVTDALDMGYAGVQMGTRFIATKEAPVHQRVKDAIVAASELDTRVEDARQT